ncbi:MAG: hypothetical protein MJ188_00775 [Treponema sp.]|nr:hypothetical protein [Treponema sp.]
MASFFTEQAVNYRKNKIEEKYQESILCARERGTTGEETFVKIAMEEAARIRDKELKDLEEYHLNEPTSNSSSSSSSYYYSLEC